MREFNVAVIAGDGVGREVVPAAKEALSRIGERYHLMFHYTDYEWGSDYFFRHGIMMPVDAIDQLRAADAILLGAVGHPDIPDHITLNGLLLPIRRTFDQFANVRPAVLFDGIHPPLADPARRPIDMVIVRENTEGEYSQIGGFLYHHQPDEVAVQSSLFTRRGCERVIRFAFELTRKRGGRRCLASITKSNAQGFGMVLWDRVFRAVASEFPDIATESLLVDAAAMALVNRPQSFDVIVASNLFGDILSDLSAAVTGGIGLAPSANIDPTRRFPSMFEPVHGSAPDIAGKGIANPLGQMFSAAMMLEHLGEDAAARSLDAALRKVIADSAVRTPDLGGSATTADVTRAVIEAVV